MKSADTKIIDIALTQALERYMDMEIEEAIKAVDAEWHPQIATFIRVFFAFSQCPSCGDYVEHAHVERAEDGCTFIIPYCSCQEIDEDSDVDDENDVDFDA